MTVRLGEDIFLYERPSLTKVLSYCTDEDKISKLQTKNFDSFPVVIAMDDMVTFEQNGIHKAVYIDVVTRASPRTPKCSH